MKFKLYRQGARFSIRAHFYLFLGIFLKTLCKVLLIFNLGPDISIFPNVRNIYGAIVVFSFTLYPYVYLVSRSAFLNQSKSMKESARLLGLSEMGVFFRLGLPIIRPAAIGGLMLVIMETLSDFGAVDHFAIQTFTTGIFRTWQGMYDLQLQCN